MKHMKRVALSITATAAFAISFAPTSAADPTAHLKTEIDAARSESGCPPLQLDPVLNGVSLRVAHEVDDYVRHSSRFLPTGGEGPPVVEASGGVLRVMREAGYSTSKGEIAWRLCRLPCRRHRRQRGQSNQGGGTTRLGF